MAELTEEQSYYRRNRKRILAAHRRRYRTDAAYRERLRRYREDPAHRAATSARNKALYAARKQGIVLQARRKGPPPRDPARALAMLKLRRGDMPLTPEELRWLLPDKRADAAEIKARTLQAVGELFGVTKQRVIQVIRRLEKNEPPPQPERGPGMPRKTDLVAGHGPGRLRTIETTATGPDA